MDDKISSSPSIDEGESFSPKYSLEETVIEHWNCETYDGWAVSG